MNTNLAQLGQQLTGIWKQLGFNQRVSVATATIVVIAGVCALAFWSNRVEYALLYGKIDDAEAAKVIGELSNAKVPYRTGQGSIYVPADKVYSMRMQLASKGIPRGDGVGFEIFDKANFGISDFVQRANYVRAVQGELSRTIGQLDEVDSARVMIVMPENRLLNDNTRRPTASVFVRLKGQAQLSASAVNSIRFLVANSVEGLQANYVSVVDNRGNVLSENTESDSLVGLTTTQLAARKNLELYFAKKAEGMLEKVLGPGQAVVRVAAEINFDTLTKTEEKFDPDGQVVRIATINDDDTTSSTVNATTGGGAPGTSTNSNTETNAATATPVNNSKMHKKVTNNTYEINKTTSSTVSAAGGVRRLTAAVFVAAKMNGAGPARVAAPRSPEELLKLRHVVQSALGIVDGDSTRKDEVTLEEMPFNDSLGEEMVQGMEQQKKQQFWFDLARSLVYPAIALVVAFVFWRALKKTPLDNIPLGVPVGQMNGNGNGHAGGNGHGNGNGNGNGNGLAGLKRKPGAQPGVLTVDVLNQLIRDNPDNASQAVRTWMARNRTAQN